MNSVIVALVALGSFYMAYKVYGKFVAQRIFSVDPGRQTPAHEYEDGTDYVPTNRNVLWGHHFTSIAGAAPIVGPAIGVIWGWVPALLWVVLGTIFMGAVHDLGALVLSVRHGGRSIGEVTGGLVSKRSRTLFLLIILFLLWLVIAVFALVIALLFTNMPATVIPIWSQMILAVGVGLAIYRFDWGITVPALVALVLMYALIWVGAQYPVDLGALGLSGQGVLITWIAIICGYALLASVLPVWLLLQPRDFINAAQLGLALVALYGGLLLAHRPIVAPAFQFTPEGAPLIFPFLFITIACGAISGFHSLVSSGTSAKQLDSEGDAQRVGYGGMVAEGVLAVAVVLACTAGVESTASWSRHYVSWQSAGKNMFTKLEPFFNGGATFLAQLGLSRAVARAFLGVVLVSFAMTTIDTATRLQRYVLSELGDNFRPLSLLRNRYVAGGVAVGSAFALAMVKGGKGGMILWPVFGATNQLLAGLALTVVTVWLLRARRAVLYTALPMVFMLGMTVTAVVLKIKQSVQGSDWLIAAVSAAILLLAVWLVVEALLAWSRIRSGAPEALAQEGPGEHLPPIADA